MTQMDDRIRRIVIVGGGTAGWLSACYLSARLRPLVPDLEVTLVESPDIATIGVGEGTWPTMRETLAQIGIDETEFLLACDASFKQGSRFDGWVSGDPGDTYLHPFTSPAGTDINASLAAWDALPEEVRFADAVTPQARICSLDLAPRQLAMPPYAGALNYAYHLDAAKLAALLSRHAVERFNVTHVAATVTEVKRRESGVVAVVTREQGEIAGDLFIDCSGFRSVLVGDALGVRWKDLSGELLNDRALAIQLPTAAGAPIASQTTATAHEAGWLWDIGLPARRGIGCVYASAHMSDDEAVAALGRYVKSIDIDADIEALSPRLLRFPTGHLETFWKDNCVAVGLSAGFIEPLEASAIVLVELSLRMLADNFPVSRDVLPIHAGRFNRLFTLRWRRIADFLKLHYVLSRRTERYWQAQRDRATVSAELRELLALWRHQPPSAYDLPLADEIFPAASHQYVYYGMRGRSAVARRNVAASAALDDVRERGRRLESALPTNRAYVDRLRDETAPVTRSAV